MENHSRKTQELLLRFVIYAQKTTTKIAYYVEN